MSEVSHEQIYNRLLAVEAKVDTIDKNTTDLVSAIEAAKGAVKVLNWIASIAQPVLWIGGLVLAARAVWQTWIKK